MCWSSKRKETNGVRHTSPYSTLCMQQTDPESQPDDLLTKEKICREISHSKLVNAVINSADERGITEAGESSATSDPNPEKFSSLPRYVEKPSISAMGEENKRKEQSEEQNLEQTGTYNQSPESCRPQRPRRKPYYL